RGSRDAASSCEASSGCQAGAWLGRMTTRIRPQQRFLKPLRYSAMKILHVRFVVAVLSTMSVCLPATAEDSASNVRTVAVPDGGKPVVAETDKDGTVHLLFESADGPRYARSTDSGVTFSAAIPVVRGGSQAAGLEYDAWDMA